MIKGNISNRKIIADSFKIIGLFLITTYIVIFMPVYVKQIYYIVLIIILLQSTDSVFWFVFYFFIFNYPFDLYYGSVLNFFRVTSTASVSFKLFVAATFFWKAYKSKQAFIMPHKKTLNLLGVYFTFLVMLSFVFGMGTKSIYQLIFTSAGLTFYYSIPKLINTTEKLFRFTKLAFALIILTFTVQIYELMNQQTIAYSLQVSNNLNMFDNSDAARQVYNSWFLFFGFSISLILLKQKSQFKKIVLFAIITISFLSVFISATRGWIFAYSIAIILSFIFDSNKTKKVFQLSIGASIIMFFLLMNPFIEKQVNAVFERLESVNIIYEKLVEGKQYSGEEIPEARTTIRYPKVMNAYKESSLIFGYGFSEKTFEFYDVHVSYASVLLSSGILGLLLIFYLWYRIIYFNISIRNSVKTSNSLKKQSIIFIIILLALIMINSSSSIHFGYIMDYQIIFNLSLFFTTNTLFAQNALLKNNKI